MVRVIESFTTRGPNANSVSRRPAAEALRR
jgi:hypothetical protein